MPRVTPRQRNRVVGHYFDGLPYSEIVRRVNLSKGSVVGIIADLKAGRASGHQDPTDQVELLREVAVDLRRRGFSISDVLVGLSCFKGLRSQGVEPASVKPMLEVYQNLTPEGWGTDQFARAAIKLRDVMDWADKDPEELMEWVAGLETKANELPALAGEYDELKCKWNSLVVRYDQYEEEGEATKEQLAEQIEELRKRLSWLQTRVAEMEKTLDTIGRKYLNKIAAVEAQEQRMINAQEAIARLDRLGLPTEKLPEISSRLEVCAKRHGVDCDRVLEWLFTWLEGISSLMGLEALLKARREGLQKLETRAEAATRREETSEVRLATLRKEMAKEEAVRQRIRKSWEKELKEVGAILRDAGHKAATAVEESGSRLRTIVDHETERLRTNAETLGHLEESIESRALVRPVVNLLQGKDGVSQKEIRIAATALCLGLHQELEGQEPGDKALRRVRERAEWLLEALRRWRV